MKLNFRKCIFFTVLISFLMQLCACGNIKEELNEKIYVDKRISDELTFNRREELSYAKKFAIDYFDEGYTLITVASGERYLVVEAGYEIPNDLEKDIIVIEGPADNIYLVATGAMDMFARMNALDQIALSGTDADYWYVPEAKKAMEDGKIKYAGKYIAPDYELIVAEKCELVIENTMILHSPQTREELELLNIPVFIDYASYEEHPLGRMEWIKVYGVLTEREQIAKQIFDAEVQEMEHNLSVKEEKMTNTPTVAYFYITQNGDVSVRKASDYIPKMIEMAGGKYIIEKDDTSNSSSSIKLQMEEFYAIAKDADILIYNSTIDGEITSIDQLLDKAGILSEFKAVKEKNVWCTTKNLYQESMDTADMITNFYYLFTDGEDAKLQYMFKLQ